MSEFNKEKILARIKKMLALANDAAASEGERDNALRMAHATLAKYNLDMASVDEVDETEKRIQDNMSTGQAPWVSTVGMAIGNLFFCRYYKETFMGKQKNFFVGKQSNVAVSIEMFKYIRDSIRRERRWQESPQSFCNGAATRIYERCQEIKLKSGRQKVPGKELTIISIYESEYNLNMEFLKSIGVHLVHSRGGMRAGEDGSYNAGREYGGKISLNNQIGNDSKPKLLK